MQDIKIYISLAFRSEGNRDFCKEAVYDFNAKDMREYISALKKEIITSSDGMDDSIVKVIEFGIGAFNNQLVSDMEDIYSLINKHFNVARNAKVILHATPGGMDFYKFTIGRHFNNAEIILEFPSVDNDDLLRQGYNSDPKQLEEVFKLSNDLQYPSLSCIIDNGKYMTETIAFLSKQKIVSISFTDTLSAAQEEVASSMLIPAGFIYSENCYTKKDLQLTDTDQLGIGLNAISTFDNISYQNTSDLNLYLKNSEDFQIIAHKI